MRFVALHGMFAFRLAPERRAMIKKTKPMKSYISQANSSVTTDTPSLRPEYNQDESELYKMLVGFAEVSARTARLRAEREKPELKDQFDRKSRFDFKP